MPSPSIVESAAGAHYRTGAVECIDAMRAALGEEQFLGYLRGTIMRYTWRLGRKDESKVEAEKIAVYSGWLTDVLAGRPLVKRNKL
jgi:hypothetical protein